MCAGYGVEGVDELRRGERLGENGPAGVTGTVDFGAGGDDERNAPRPELLGDGRAAAAAPQMHVEDDGVAGTCRNGHEGLLDRGDGDNFSHAEIFEALRHVEKDEGLVFRHEDTLEMR